MTIHKETGEVEFDGECRQAKQIRIFTVIEALCESPLTTAQIGARLDCSDRTVIRYMAQLGQLGVKIYMAGGNARSRKYYLKECPFCKREV